VLKLQFPIYFSAVLLRLAEERHIVRENVNLKFADNGLRVDAGQSQQSEDGPRRAGFIPMTLMSGVSVQQKGCPGLDLSG
jgi:hypothetical protein